MLNKQLSLGTCLSGISDWSASVKANPDVHWGDLLKVRLSGTSLRRPSGRFTESSVLDFSCGVVESYAFTCKLCLLCCQTAFDTGQHKPSGLKTEAAGVVVAVWLNWNDILWLRKKIMPTETRHTVPFSFSPRTKWLDMTAFVLDTAVAQQET